MVGPGIRYISRLVKMTFKRGGKMPLIKKGVEAVVAGPMSRREFFGRSKQIINEAQAQGEMLSARATFESEQKKGLFWLQKNADDVHKLKSVSLEADLAAQRHSKKLERKMDWRDYPDPRNVDNAPSPSSEVMGWELDEAEKMVRNKVTKKRWGELGITRESARKIDKHQEMADFGYDKINDPSLNKWFDARDKWMEATGSGTTRAAQWGPGRQSQMSTTSRADRILIERPGAYSRRKRARPEIRESYLYPEQTQRERWTEHWGDLPSMQVGKDLIKEVKKDAKKSASKVKSIWEGLKKEYEKGLHSVD